jgi:hypothetical protein
VAVVEKILRRRSPRRLGKHIQPAYIHRACRTRSLLEDLRVAGMVVSIYEVIGRRPAGNRSPDANAVRIISIIDSRRIIAYPRKPALKIIPVRPQPLAVVTALVRFYSFIKEQCSENVLILQFCGSFRSLLFWYKYTSYGVICPVECRFFVCFKQQFSGLKRVCWPLT